MRANDHEAFFDEASGTMVLSEVAAEEVDSSLLGQIYPAQVRRALANWAEVRTPSSRRSTSLFSRDKYVTPNLVLEQMAMAYDTLDDDIVGNVADMSEAMAFQKLSFECSEPDQEDVWNQIGRDLNLDAFCRTAWRELYTVSQFYAVKWWAFKEYKVRGTRDSRAARKSYNLRVPVKLGFLDPTRVVPVKNDVFGEAKLAWIATDSELETLETLGSPEEDPFLRALWVGPYKPGERESRDLRKENIPVDRLIELNPEYVFRHTLTKSPYERWSRIRLKSIFTLLDLKHQLREMDRAFLLGGINFLVLVTRGSDQLPATKNEVEGTATQVRTQSRTPIIISDHRISIEIITPDIEHILDDDKWGVLDERVIMRLWGTFQLPSQASSRETSMTLARVIARGLESRRHMLKRTLEKELIRAVTEDPFNEKAGFTEDATIEFAPRRMELEMDAALITVIQELRDRGDLSRETVLNELNFDQALEARRREVEKREFDKSFPPTNVPFDSPNRPTTPGGAGRQGGSPPGGNNPDGNNGGGGDT